MNESPAATPTRAQPDSFLLLMIIGAARELEGRAERALGEVGLSLAKTGVLHALTKAGGSLTLGSVAEMNKCVRSNVTQLIDRMESDGLVERQNDPEDRRIRRAALTTAGIDAYRQAIEILGKQDRVLLTAFGAEEAEGLRRSLVHLSECPCNDVG